MAEAIFTEERFGNGVVVRAIYDDATNRFIRVETENPTGKACTFWISRQNGSQRLTMQVPVGSASWPIPPGSVNRYNALNDVKFGVNC